ncbi:uncharacterized protein [Periplaneta americana]|uniref:uncharacterized protein n=1 Tax=Periplaneta americana TaxID=6978 RepID=UPI0037E80260
MKVSMQIVFLALLIAVCAALPRTFQEEEPETRERRSPVPQGEKLKVGVYDESRKGLVARAEGSRTVWESKDKNIKAKVGVDYTQPLNHGRGEGSVFLKVGGTF